MNTERLRYFVETYRQGNLYKAADSIGITHQGISHSIRQLEKHYGVMLFSRTSSGVSPTQFADSLYDKAVKILAEEEDIERIAQNFRDSAGGEVKIGLLGDNLLSHMVKLAGDDFAAVHPDVDISTVFFDEENPKAELQSIQDGSIDFGWMFNCGDIEGFDSYALRTTQIGILVGPNSPLYDHDEVEWSEILPYNLILPGKNDMYSLLVERFLASHGCQVPPENKVFSNDTFTVCHLVEDKNYVMSSNSSYYASMKALCRGSKLIAAKPRLNMSISFLVRKGASLNDAQRSVLNYMVDYFKGNFEDNSIGF